jgi:hypothetical protein
MSGPMSAFARYSDEASSPPQTDSVLPASRKRKRVSMVNTNGHSKENSTNKNRSKSHTIEQTSTTKKPKNLEKKFLSPAYPTPYPQRRVVISESHRSPVDEPALEENGETDEDEEEEDEVRNLFLFFEV